jgi:HD superfamily phosphohydrolase
VDEQKVATTLVAGLLHDIGQSSFAHSLEDVTLLPRHEELADRFILGTDIADHVPDYMVDAGPLSDVLAKEWPEVNLERLRWMIAGTSAVNVAPDTGWEIMRAIISGPLDADKTDYLLRDALHAGVEYPRSIDVPRFMNSLTASVVRKRLRPAGVLAITWKGSQAAEMITLARTQMFWVLYWHHAVRAAHAMVAHSAYHHLRECSTDERLKLQRTMFCAPIGELLAELNRSPSDRARQLAALLRVRRLYKRGLSLDFVDEEGIYLNLLELKSDCEAKGDPLLTSVSEAVAESMNELFASEGRPTRVRANDIIVDIPRADKDKLGTIYVVPPDATDARRYVSRGIAGSNEDWQNRARSARVFVSPEMSRGDRALVSDNALEILQRV